LSLDVDAVASTNAILGDTDLDAVATEGALDGVLTTGITGASTTGIAGVLSAQQLRTATDDCIVSGDGQLPDTGGENIGLLYAAGGLIAAGGALIASSERRRRRA
ncbi:MAG: LPXTG cell wall anchor domain-containing protein, partial [Actinomycetales bacterium]